MWALRALMSKHMIKVPYCYFIGHPAQILTVHAFSGEASSRNWPFLVGITCLWNSFWKELHQQHKPSSNERVNKAMASNVTPQQIKDTPIFYSYVILKTHQESRNLSYNRLWFTAHGCCCCHCANYTVHNYVTPWHETNSTKWTNSPGVTKSFPSSLALYLNKVPRPCSETERGPERRCRINTQGS